MMEDTRPRCVAYVLTHSPPVTVQGPARERLHDYIEAVAEQMPPDAYILVCNTGQMFLDSMEPTITKFDAFVLAFTLHAQANEQPI